MKKPNTSFGHFAQAWDDRAGNKGVESAKERIKAITEFLGTVKGKIIYEIACGNGYLSRKFVKDGAREVWASDIAPELITIAQTKYDPSGIKYLARDGSNFDKIPANHFDVVVIQHGLFYIKDIDTLVKGIHKILKPGGIFIYTLSHPLMHVARKDIGEKYDIMTKYREYLQIKSKLNTMHWDNPPVTYLSYQRPLSYYINACSKRKLFTVEMREPQSQTFLKKEIKKSSIPSSLIIKAVKV